jgi:hypothetical protein
MRRGGRSPGRRPSPRPALGLDHHGPGSNEVDIVLTWSLSEVDGATLVVLTLDEFERGPDPVKGLEEILDVLSVARRTARP